jgi:LPXTG-site transpeptidase (sortase) family protein
VPDRPDRNARLATLRRQRGIALVAFGAVLILAGIGTALWLYTPDISWELGLVEPRFPYPSRLATGTVVPESDRMPTESAIVIPRIGAVAPIFEGSPETALDKGVYRHAETARPGEGKNVTIAGHRESRAFALLSRLEPGDAIIVYWEGVEHDYRVTEVSVTTPDDDSVLWEGSSESLTLYTCVPRTEGDQRTVVRAVPY